MDLLDGQVSFFQKWPIQSYQTSLSEDFHLSPTKAIFEEEKNAHMPEIGQNLKTKTFWETVEQKECNDKW